MITDFVFDLFCCNLQCQIMTDAALLKRQKTEIEELRAKLQVDIGIGLFNRGCSSYKIEVDVLIYHNSMLACLLLFISKGLHSEHLEEEILNLRNTLLKVRVMDYGCYIFEV